MAHRYQWGPITTSKAMKLADGILPDAWLSSGGKLLLRIIDVLGIENPNVGQIFFFITEQLAQPRHWDMPRMTISTEQYFLRWIIGARLKEKGLIP